ncbi:SUN domain-containing ossification factor-like [Paramisgurnus dabryanus]|uniref:SUN domain-containing ossification factor-like n=1 Tax=Paramisgurnus dabryanus TaxID=90735 RepID=UPI0031F3FF80
MKLQLLLLASVFGLFYYCFPVCSEASGAQTLTTDINSHHDKPSKKTRNHEMNEGSEEKRVFISASEEEEDVLSVTAAHPDDSEMVSSCSNVKVDESKSIITRESACDQTEKLQYDPSLSRFNVNETEKPIKTNKDQTGIGTNVSHILKKQGGNMSPEIDPSPLCKDQEIPTFDEWTKIMMEVENEKSQSLRVSNGLHGKKVQQTFTNYASVECGAKILSSNPEAKSTSAILMENMDMYMLNPCNNKIWFIIELCQPIQVRQLDIANFEIFSSNPKDFLVSISDRYPTNRWLKLGTFHARDERTVHSFPLDEHLFAKYIKVELLSHFGSEHFCPLSMVRVFGTSMMEEYEMNSSDRPHSRDDQDYDESPDFVPLDDKSTKNLIGSAKDVLLTMVNSIAANVLGGNPNNTAGEGGNDSTEDLNMSGLSLLTQPIHSTSSAVSETVVVSGLLNETTVTTGIPGETGAHKIESTFTGLLSEDPTAQTHAKDLHIHPDLQQIVTLLPDDDGDDESDGSLDENLKRLKTNQLKCHVNVSLSSFSLQEYLLKRCSSQSINQKKKMKPVSCSQASTLLPQTKHFISTTTMPFAIQPTTIANEQMSSEVSLTYTETPPVAEMFESSLESGSLEPSLTSNFLKPSAESFKVTHPIELECLSFSDCLQLKIPQERSSEKPLKTSLSHLTLSTAEKSRSDHQITQQSNLKISTRTVSSNTVDPSQLASSSPLVDHPMPKPTKDETVADVLLTPTQPILPIDGSLGSPESKSKDVFDDTMLETKGITSEIDSEMHNSSDVPMHGSSQKESVFMRLNNRIKVLEMNMSLSGRYLEQLSQRYRKQVDEMQKAFNQTVIKLQNTSRMAEEQDQKQTDSIEMLQIQLENVTRLLFSLSVSVSQLQKEVSERQSYIVLCLVLCVVLGLLICCNHHQILCDAPLADSDTSSYPERDLVDCYRDVFVRRRASDPLSQSSFQIKAGAEEMNDPEQCLHSPQKKQHQLKFEKSSEHPTSSVLNSSPASLAHEISQGLRIGSGPLLVTRDLMSDVSSSKSNENLFCGLSTCVSLCEALPAPTCWTEKKNHEQADMKTSAERLHQIPQCTAPLPGLGPSLNLH